jgi:hypothetical protein
VNRQKALQEAAKLAEMANAEDLAITLLERADAPLSAFEQEVIALYNERPRGIQIEGK